MFISIVSQIMMAVSGIMRPDELSMFQRLDHKVSANKWFLPLIWTADILKLGLEEALLSQQLVSQELEVLRSSTSDQDLVEHIRSLEEQLRSQTSELTKQRVASSHIQDIR